MRRSRSVKAVFDVSDKWVKGIVDWMDEQFDLSRDYGYKEIADMWRRYYPLPDDENTEEYREFMRA